MQSSSLGDQIGALVTARWASANTEFQREQAAVRVRIQEMQEALEATSTEGLPQAAAEIKTIDADREAEKVRLAILLKDIANCREGTAQTRFLRVGAHEHSAPRGGGNYEGASTPGSRAPAFESLTLWDAS